MKTWQFGKAYYVTDSEALIESNSGSFDSVTNDMKVILALKHNNSKSVSVKFTVNNNVLELVKVDSMFDKDLDNYPQPTEEKDLFYLSVTKAV